VSCVRPYAHSGIFPIKNRFNPTWLHRKGHALNYILRRSLISKTTSLYLLFILEISSFNGNAKELTDTVKNLSDQVEREKLRALGTSNALLAVSRERETQRQQFQALIVDKTTELERLRAQHQALINTEEEQQQLLQQLTM